MFRVFSTAILILISTSGCAAVLTPQAWMTRSEALVLEPSAEVRVAVVPPEERAAEQVDRPAFPVPLEAQTSPEESTAQFASTDRETPATMVRVYYGTNRRMGNQPTGNQYGTCDVSIPSRHQFGELECPSLWRLEFRESAAKHVLLKSVTPLTGDVCLNQLRGDLSQTTSSEIFVFVHGYNVTFAEAAMRTAQMAFDLRFAGVPLFYSWPSRGDLSGYGSDLKQADLSAGPLAEFLNRVASESGARRIHLVAHSMGNRALVGALSRLSGMQPAPRFDQVVFAAPDLDAGQFATDIAPRIRPTVQRVTIYSSGSDLALWASRIWNRTVRLGQPGRTLYEIGEYDWIDVVDATSIGFDWFELGHSAYGSELLVDLHRTLAGRPIGAPSQIGNPQTWTVTRPSPFEPPRSNAVYRIRPTHWPPAPVDRWR
jgi:esterase/lipase superfamily enzyme